MLHFSIEVAISLDSKPGRLFIACKHLHRIQYLLYISLRAIGLNGQYSSSRANIGCDWKLSWFLTSYTKYDEKHQVMIDSCQLIDPCPYTGTCLLLNFLSICSSCLYTSWHRHTLTYLRSYSDTGIDRHISVSTS